MTVVLTMLGVALMLVGFLSVIKPIQKLKIKNRKSGTIVLVIGLVLLIGGAVATSSVEKENAQGAVATSSVEKEKARAIGNALGKRIRSWLSDK